MLDAKALSAAIRAKKKNLLRQDLDSAGQESLDPNAVEDIKQNLRVGQTMEEAGVEGYDHPPISPEAMGEGDDSQDVKKLKRVSSRIASYFKGL